MNEQIKAGADIHAGDGGYSEGTQEQYDAFVKVRNKSLAQGRIRDLALQATTYIEPTSNSGEGWIFDKEKFAELIVRECINREELLGAIARGWCSEKNSHKTMDPDLALAIFDEVEQQIKQQFGVE